VTIFTGLSINRSVFR